MIMIKDITKKFGNRTILKNISCTLKQGKSYAIIGKSGVGKSTFLNIIGGLEQPTTGKIIINNEPLSTKNIKRLRRDQFGFIFQNFGLIDNDSVGNNLAIGLANQNSTKKEKYKEMQMILKQLGLENVTLKQPIHTLSGGEQQRIALARIVLKKPKIIFADEPTGSLDEENSRLLMKHLLNDFDHQAIILIATHDPKIWQCCDYVIKIVEQNIQISSKER